MSRNTQALNRSEFPNPKPNQLVKCRGGTWRFIKEEKGFWQLELIKQGTQFTEEAVTVWALPNLERNSLELLEGREALAPRPFESQVQKAKNYSAHIHARKSHALEDTEQSALPLTAMNCAIERKDWQFEPWRRVVDQLPFPRLLIADDVGLGKTTQAAIILAELTKRKRADRVLVIAPQHLAEKWQDELYERFGLAFEIYDRETRNGLLDRGVKNPWEVVERVIVSRDFIKRWENLKPLRNVEWDMVVIDECHHFVREKNKSHNRLREMAEDIVYNSPGLIMLSATPFTGSEEEFHSLLKLIDPKFHSKTYSKGWNPKNPYLVRRLKGNVAEYGEDIKQREIFQVTVNEEDLSKFEKDTLEAVHQELAEQSSLSKREYWDRLLEETARKRLSSGWGAFYQTVMGSSRLREWFSSKTLKKVHKLAEDKNFAKLKALGDCIKEIHQNTPKSKVVVFTEAIPSQEDIYSYLTESATYKTKQVAMIAGDTGKEERLDIEDRFASQSSELLVLIATDTISEGKDLQHACHHLIHFELPWSLVKIEQRNGRIDRLGQRQTPKIYNIVFDTEATPDQRVIDRLLGKLEVAKESLGSVSPIVAQFENLDKDQLRNDGKALEKQIDEITHETQEFGLDLQSVTPLSSTTLDAKEDAAERLKNFSVMLKTLGGELKPFGELDKQFSLSLPTGNNKWNLPGLDSVGEYSYPDQENPWRVTFDPMIFLEYEEYRRNQGDARVPLHFISPIHPVAVQVESRFKTRLSREGYPIFSVKNMIHRYVVMAELTIRSKSSRVMNQRLVAFECKKFSEVNINLLDEFKGSSEVSSLPNTVTWDKVIDHLEKISIEYAETTKSEFQKKLRGYRAEQNEIPGNAQGRLERETWLKNLWEVDVNQTQFQVLALLVKSEG